VLGKRVAVCVGRARVGACLHHLHGGNIVCDVMYASRWLVCSRVCCRHSWICGNYIRA
jgi:hypothetical protein